MTTLTKLDASVVSLLCCPLCKGPLVSSAGGFMCKTCGSNYGFVGTPEGKVCDFKIRRPPYVTPKALRESQRLQQLYEEYDERHSSQRNNLQEYLDEIDAVREIYTHEFHITGNVLDVGGHQGRLRHYLSELEVPLYVSVDPFIGAFRYSQRSNLLRAFPCLAAPCNFLSCHAESLPFVASCFDWVHMRSVVDHFADPYLAFKEAYRVLKSAGQVLIGLSIMERMPPARQGLLRRGAQKVRRALRKVRSAGFVPTLKVAAERILRPEQEHHNFRLTYDELRDLLSVTGLGVEKEHWQKAPFSHVIYISARKPALG